MTLEIPDCGQGSSDTPQDPVSTGMPKLKENSRRATQQLSRYKSLGVWSNVCAFSEQKPTNVNAAQSTNARKFLEANSLDYRAQYK